MAIVVLESNMYNMVHGVEPTADVTLTCLKLDPRMIGRFRDAYVTYRDASKLEPVFVVMTRTGGGNRASYQEENAALTAHPDYLDDRDDEFDSTFALFRFTVASDRHDNFLGYLEQHGTPLSLAEKMRRIEAGIMTPRQKAGMEKIAATLKKAFDKPK